MRKYTQKIKHSIYPPKLINNYVAHVLYININERKDRKARLLKTLNIFDKNKITRISAVKSEINPVLACTLSHQKAIKYAKMHNYSNVLILEDDAVWSNVTNGFDVFEKLIKNPYDVIMLGATHVKFNKDSNRIYSAYTSHAYLVHHTYYDSLLDYIEKELQANEPILDTNNSYAIDVIYSKFQKKDRWYLVNPALMIQGKSYSDIGKRIVNYESKFII